MESELPSGGERVSPRCPKCSSTDVRRTMPRNARERVLRSFLPMRLFFCRSCEQRSWIWGSYGSSEGSSSGSHHHAAGGRELEARDRALARKVRKQIFRSIMLALTLGAIMGVYFTHCQEQRRLREEAAASGGVAP